MIKWLSDLLNLGDMDGNIVLVDSLRTDTVQECPETTLKLQSVRVHMNKQFDSHAQNNAMLMHKGDCDIFTCQGCDERIPDKIVGEPYQVKR